MRQIPLKSLPSQEVQILLNGQACQIKVYQKRYGLFVDLYVNSVLVIGGVVAEDRNRIVRDAYLGFSGDLAFFDTQGTNDPDYTGFGGQFAFAYLTPDELAARGLTG